MEYDLQDDLARENVRETPAELGWIIRIPTREGDGSLLGLLASNSDVLRMNRGNGGLGSAHGEIASLLIRLIVWRFDE